MMSYLELLDYARDNLVYVPWTHWAAMAGVSLALTVFFLVKKRSSVYGAIALGLTVFMGLLLLDTTAVVRFLGLIPHKSGYDFSFNNLFHIPENRRIEFFSNVLVFIPFGFFLSEFLSMTKRFHSLRRLGLATLAASGISLCIECLQLFLHVGFFELTDLVLNTLGGFIGAGVSVGRRRVSKAIMDKFPGWRNAHAR